MSLLSIATAPVSEQPAAQGAAGSKLLQRRHSTSPRGQHRRTLLMMVIVIMFVGAVVLDYVSPCRASSSTRDKLLYMVHSWDELMTELEVVHWVDFGTLVGAVHYGDLVPWDYDADVSFDRRYAPLLHEGRIGSQLLMDWYGIRANAAMMEYEGVQVDIFSWTLVHNDTHPDQSKYVKSRRRHSDWFEQTYSDFEARWVEPTQAMPLGGKMVQVPAKPVELLHQRYPSLRWGHIPYKCSCWLVWNWPIWMFHSSPKTALDRAEEE